MPRRAKTASDAMATFTIMTGNKDGIPGMKAKTIKEKISTTNKIATDLAMPILSEINPANNADGGLIHIFPILMAPAATTLNEKISVEYDVNL